MTEKLKRVDMKLKKIASNKKIVKRVGSALIAVAYVMFVVAVASEFVFAADDTILDNISSLLESVKTYILKFSTFALFIGLGIGAMMKKFSMGKQDKIEMGNKLMKDSLIAYIILNATPRIVNFVTSKLGNANETINM